jgi:Flp pilus assembly protein TadD
MLSVLLFFAAAASSDEYSRLVRCIEHSERACVATVLSGPTHDRSPVFLSAAARGYVLLGDRAQAVKVINEAVAQSPGNFELLMSQGWVYQRCGDQVSAIRSFLLASQIDKGSAKVFYDLGMSFSCCTSSTARQLIFNMRLN